MNSCIDCKHIWAAPFPARCKHPSCIWPVHGLATAMVQEPTTEYARGPKGNCGSEGTLWEKAE